MAELDPVPPHDATEAAYREALLSDEAGREQRRARLMAALPRPEAAAATAVARSELAWRWQPYALGVLVTGLLLAAVLVLKERPAEPGQTVDPRVAAAPAASAPVVVAQAEPPLVPSADARVAAAPPVAAKAAAPKPRAVQPPAVVVADAGLPQQRREVEAAVTAATESARLAVEPPPAAPVMAPVPVPPAPAAPVMAAAPAPSPPAAPAVAAAPVAPPASKFNQAEALARAEVTDLASARSRMSLAASDAAPAKLMTPAESFLLAAANHADLAMARSALQAGASVHLRDAQGRTVLMLAARTGSREVVDLLLATGARKTDRDPQGWTAADHARDGGHGELAERLR